MVVLLNRGTRTWDLHDGVEVDGKLVRRQKTQDGHFNPKDKVVKRRLLPNASIEALDDDEANLMLGYKHEIVDGEKVMPQMGDKVKVLQDTIVSLNAKISELEERLAKNESDKEDGRGKGKGK